MEAATFGGVPGISPGRESGRMFAGSTARLARAARGPLHWIKRAAAASALFLSACSGGYSPGELWSGLSPAPAPPTTGSVIGAGQVKVALILPLSASGNAGVAAQ